MSTLERANTVHNLTPLISVADIEQSVAFYCDSLGFQLSDRWAPEGRLAWCRVERGGSAVMLQQACDEEATVTDRGRGITGDISTAAGAGLSGMHERVELLGGWFRVSSRPGRGTTIEAQIPLPEPDGDRP